MIDPWNGIFGEYRQLSDCDGDARTELKAVFEEMRELILQEERARCLQIVDEVLDPVRKPEYTLLNIAIKSRIQPGCIKKSPYED